MIPHFIRFKTGSVVVVLSRTHSDMPLWTAQVGKLLHRFTKWENKKSKAKFNCVVRFRLYNDNRNPTSEMKQVYWNGCDDIFVSVTNFALFLFQVSDFPSAKLTISVCWKWGLFFRKLFLVAIATSIRSWCASPVVVLSEAAIKLISGKSRFCFDMADFTRCHLIFTFPIFFMQ